LVVDTHPWLPLSQKVLISPISLLEFSADNYAMTVSLSKDMVKSCPKVEEHETVSREFEKIYYDYFGYGYYWTGEGAWGEYAYPTALFHGNILPFENIETDNSETDNVADDNLETANHLRSANELAHYSIDAVDGKKGHIYDFIWDTYNWSLRYLVIDTRDWLPGGKHVLVSPEQFESFNWGSRTVSCNIGLHQIKACSEYPSDKLNDSQYLEQVKQKLQGIK
jgi:hypothetical protein